MQGNHDLDAVRHAQLEPRDRGMSWDTIAWLEALPQTRHYIPMRFRWAHHWMCNPGSITLPEMTLEVYSMQTGQRVELGE